MSCVPFLGVDDKACKIDSRIPCLMNFFKLPQRRFNFLVLFWIFRAIQTYQIFAVPCLMGLYWKSTRLEDCQWAINKGQP